MTLSENRDRPVLALIIRLGAIAALATMSALIKVAGEHHINLLEILFWRQFIALPIILLWLIPTTGVSALATSHPGKHARRAVYGLIGMMLNFGGVMLLPLAEATTMSFTAPIWAVILSMLLLKEKIGLYRWAAVIFGFAGVLIIAQPGGSHLPLVGAAVALAGAFMVALISIQIADLNKTEKPLTIVFWFATFSSVAMIFPLFFVFTKHSTFEWLLLLGIGISGTTGQILLTSALRFGKVASVIVMDYSALFWATIYGWLIWQTLPPASTWIGAPLIIAAGMVIAWREHFLARVGRRTRSS
ncbi:DMT family transporter [Altericroceibacterium spongiae]|uniref:DMT family transporter n=1 Tax=Altericroceibacterium spongiae TaxID=2320269 RepID=A0A420EMW6_9SPHN|nr:DMT family transporter [Altericroceibacterium spongiae]RKF21946.1 DMT family transporter [Altericroceibacterium spongiae]